MSKSILAHHQYISCFRCHPLRIDSERLLGAFWSICGHAEGFVLASIYIAVWALRLYKTEKMIAEACSLERPTSSTRTGVWALSFVALFSLVHVYVSLMLVPKFTEMFKEMSLAVPSWTASIIHCRWLFVGFDCIWLLAAFFIFQRRASTGFLYGILALLLLEIALTVIGLFLPLIGRLETVSL